MKHIQEEKTYQKYLLSPGGIYTFLRAIHETAKVTTLLRFRLLRKASLKVQSARKNGASFLISLRVITLWHTVQLETRNVSESWTNLASLHIPAFNELVQFVSHCTFQCKKKNVTRREGESNHGQSCTVSSYQQPRTAYSRFSSASLDSHHNVSLCSWICCMLV